MEREQESERRRYLIEWAHVIERAAHRGIFGGRPIALRETTLVNGPRAGALEIDAGLAIGKLMQQLAADDFALHRQFVPWRFAGEPSVYMTGRCVRLEAGWPDSLAENDIPLQSIGAHPRKGGRWIAGKNEIGATITLGLSDQVPHYQSAAQA